MQIWISLFRNQRLLPCVNIHKRRMNAAPDNAGGNVGDWVTPEQAAQGYTFTPPRAWNNSAFVCDMLMKTTAHPEPLTR